MKKRATQKQHRARLRKLSTKTIETDFKSWKKKCREAWAKVADPIKKPSAAFVTIGKIPDEAKLYVAMSLYPDRFKPIWPRLKRHRSHLERVARRRKEALSLADKAIRALVRWETGAVSNMTHDAKLNLRKKIARKLKTGTIERDFKKWRATRRAKEE